MEGIVHAKLNGRGITITRALARLDAQGETRMDFRCLECGEAVTLCRQAGRYFTRGLPYFQHLKWNPSCPNSDKLSRLQEQVLQYPLVWDLDLSELSKPQQQGEEAIVISRRGRRPALDRLELIDLEELKARYPKTTAPVQTRRSRSKYPFDILDVGETRKIGPASKRLLNNVQSAIWTHRRKHDGEFEAVIIDDGAGPEVALHRRA